MSLRNSIRRSSHGFHRAFIIAALILFSANGWAGNVLVFGPKSYVRGTGAPVTVTDTFTVQNPSGQFTLHLSNGGLQHDTSEFVSSTVITEGANQVVSGTATDKAGNSASTSVSLKIDKTPPSLTIASPANNSTVSTATVQLTGTASDALSGIASTTCNGTAAVLQSNAF